MKQSEIIISTIMGCKQTLYQEDNGIMENVTI